MSPKKTFCELESEGFLEKNFEEYKDLVKKGKFVYRNCGRVARKKSRVCQSEKL
jgi:hypothetical protein